MNDTELVVEALPHALVRLRVALRQTLLAEIAQVRLVVLVRRWDRIVRQLQMAELERDVAALGDAHRIRERLRMVREECRHLLWRLEVVVVAREAHAVGIVDCLSHLDAEQDVVELAVLAVHVVQVVRRHEADAVFLRERDEPLVRLALLRQAMVLDLEEIVLLAEDRKIFAHDGIRALRLVRDERAWHLARHARRKADEPLVVLPEQIVIDAGLVVEALDVRTRDELHEVAVARLVLREQDEVIVLDAVHLGAFLAPARRHVDLTADDGLHALRHGLLVEINDTVHRAVIRNRDGRHARLLDGGDELRDAARAVEQTVLRMHVQMHERWFRSYGNHLICRKSRRALDAAKHRRYSGRQKENERTTAMPKVTREDIPNWFQKKTGFDVDIEELKKAAELDRIACADEPMKLMRDLWGITPRDLEHLLGAPARTVEQWFYAKPSRPASWVVRLIVEKCAALHERRRGLPR